MVNLRSLYTECLLSGQEVSISLLLHGVPTAGVTLLIHHTKDSRTYGSPQYLLFAKPSFLLELIAMRHSGRYGPSIPSE